MFLEKALTLLHMETHLNDVSPLLPLGANIPQWLLIVL